MQLAVEQILASRKGEPSGMWRHAAAQARSGSGSGSGSGEATGQIDRYIEAEQMYAAQVLLRLAVWRLGELNFEVCCRQLS
jgi:hypothetical protein